MAGKRTASQADVQKARSFLFSHHKRGFRIEPRKFAASARELGVGFRELLRFISQLYAQGQQSSTFRRAAITRMTTK